MRILSGTQFFIFVPRLSNTSHVDFQNAGVAVVLFLLDFFFDRTKRKSPCSWSSQVSLQLILYVPC